MFVKCFCIKSLIMFSFQFPLQKLLSGEKKAAPFWTFEYYQRFFDIETHHVNI